MPSRIDCAATPASKAACTAAATFFDLPVSTNVFTSAIVDIFFSLIFIEFLFVCANFVSLKFLTVNLITSTEYRQLASQLAASGRTLAPESLQKLFILQQERVYCCSQLQPASVRARSSLQDPIVGTT
jgi:hypothetical protein